MSQDDVDTESAWEITEPIPTGGAFDCCTMLVGPSSEVVCDEFGLCLHALPSDGLVALVDRADDDRTTMKVNS